MTSDKDLLWMIWSNEHRAWWRPFSCGYTRKVEEAGLYSYDEAKFICFPPSFRGFGGDWPPPEIMVAEWGDDLISLTKEHFQVDRRDPPMTDSTWEQNCQSAPLGTKAPAFNGGHWTKTERGWRWGKRGATFPTPGGDWTGELIPPKSDKPEEVEQS